MDIEIRLAAFKWLQEQSKLHGDIFPRSILEQGFHFHGKRITLIGPRGIWKPKSMTVPISIATIPGGPYNDSLPHSDGAFLEYKYRGENPLHPDNVGLRICMQDQIPLIYFLKIAPGKYLAEWPVYIQGDNPEMLTFSVALDSKETIGTTRSELQPENSSTALRRSYLTSSITTRVHQKAFREKVISAYQTHCALCRLRHAELLDAAHIIPDKEEGGDPIVPNGLSLCKIHHAAFDNNIIGITPDYIVKVNEEVLREIDGPMLKYGIQSMHNQGLFLPKKKIEYPDPERLDYRYQKFLKAG